MNAGTEHRGGKLGTFIIKHKKYFSLVKTRRHNREGTGREPNHS